ncbi:hypothetical protein [Pseudomonas phage vB_PaeM_RP7]|nr:MAG: hypothetical protein [Pseudomonas phage RP4]WAB56758.1 hypothetical protein [Pseudomonas phage vB_PaeM_RP15]WAB56872.1 hypothetical protein [Pseudomonas phage vB_PaeM_RP6]WAB57047.1 hypothetical protein [Pseudomonas phage vB_PaeM_RP7]WAB57356.1 hypothetical protein [Pseudomonas phage vB_PaeM_RP8]WAB57383.1 hypothetical protein [Pseudomonas phage vB_PaeM_RP9]WAB57671.1 hypothetical protein [Pseudomonas phage vB_PaeM_RP10]WAB57787.1 hypothetical protein [Pseudomonas phage vB_PaeM_RP11]
MMGSYTLLLGVLGQHQSLEGLYLASVFSVRCTAQTDFTVQTSRNFFCFGDVLENDSEAFIAQAFHGFHQLNLSFSVSTGTGYSGLTSFYLSGLLDGFHGGDLFGSSLQQVGLLLEFILQLCFGCLYSFVDEFLTHRAFLFVGVVGPRSGGHMGFQQVTSFRDADDCRVVKLIQAGNGVLALVQGLQNLDATYAAFDVLLVRLSVHLPIFPFSGAVPQGSRQHLCIAVVHVEELPEELRELQLHFDLGGFQHVLRDSRVKCLGYQGRIPIRRATLSLMDQRQMSAFMVKRDVGQPAFGFSITHR